MKTFSQESAFDLCATTILDAIEEAWAITPEMRPNGRHRTHETLKNLLAYFCIPRNGPLTVEELEEQLRVRGVSQ